MDLRCVLCVAAGALFAVFLLGASWIAFPSASFFLLQYSPATQRAPPRFAYLISGSAGDAGRLRRCLLALYHPRNHYILHLDAEAPDSDRTGLAAFVAAHPVVAAVGNVRVVEKANLVTYRGITMVTTTLHATAIFLRGPGADWDWFINLSASDYSLVTQDDLMDVFSRLPRDLNFIEHTGDLGWKAPARVMPVVVDRGLYMKTKQDLLWMNETEKRELPTAFTLFTGSAWMVLSRPFVEYLIWGWDNLPRTVLLYYANFVSSPEGYFQTVVCSANEFRNTTVNHDMHYISWDNPPGQHPQLLNASHWDKMVGNKAPFARKFGQDDMVLDRIDADLLLRPPGMVTPGGWCRGDVSRSSDGPCCSVGSPTRLLPGPGAARLQRLVTSLMLEKNFRSKQCKIEHNY
ncbi:beta-glucuronosyltransferase GlcAT14A-like [Aegilops tauschii subsp. strangulata]